MSEFDLFLADCPARTTLSLVGDTWSVIVITGLGDGPARYGSLQTRIGGISNKMLSQVLRKLQNNGLVTRTALATAPPGAEYELTELGQSLLEPVRALSRWAEEHTDAVLEAQDAAMGLGADESEGTVGNQ
jgi:DNA-binding HxlR family transcriptional regulator